MFSQSQLTALGRLGLPVWHQQDTSTKPSFYYRLDRFLIVFQQHLPVHGYAWLQDIADHLHTSIVAVSESAGRNWNSAQIIDLRDQGQESPVLPTAELKQAIWQQLLEAGQSGA